VRVATIAERCGSCCCCCCGWGLPGVLVKEGSELLRAKPTPRASAARFGPAACCGGAAAAVLVGWGGCRRRAACTRPDAVESSLAVASVEVLASSGLPSSDINALHHTLWVSLSPTLNPVLWPDLCFNKKPVPIVSKP